MITCILVALVIRCTSPEPRPTPQDAAAIFLTSHPEPPAPAPFVAPPGWTDIGPIVGDTFSSYVPFGILYPRSYRNDRHTRSLQRQMHMVGPNSIGWPYPWGASAVLPVLPQHAIRDDQRR